MSHLDPLTERFLRGLDVPEDVQVSIVPLDDGKRAVIARRTYQVHTVLDRSVGGEGTRTAVEEALRHVKLFASTLESSDAIAALSKVQREADRWKSLAAMKENEVKELYATITHLSKQLTEAEAARRDKAVTSVSGLDELMAATGGTRRNLESLQVSAPDRKRGDKTWSVGLRLRDGGSQVGTGQSLPDAMTDLLRAWSNG